MTDSADTSDGGGGERTGDQWLRESVAARTGSPILDAHGGSGYETDLPTERPEYESGDEWARQAYADTQGGDGPKPYVYDLHLADARAEAEAAHEAHQEHLVADGVRDGVWEAEAVRLHAAAVALDKYVAKVVADGPRTSIDQGPRGDAGLGHGETGNEWLRRQAWGSVPARPGQITKGAGGF